MKHLRTYEQFEYNFNESDEINERFLGIGDYSASDIEKVKDDKSTLIKYMIDTFPQFKIKGEIGKINPQWNRALYYARPENLVEILSNLKGKEKNTLGFNTETKEFYWKQEFETLPFKAYSTQEVEDAKGNKVELDNIFRSVFREALSKFGDLRNKYKVLIQKPESLDMIYNCLAAGAKDGFKGSLRWDTEKNIFTYVEAKNVKTGEIWHNR